MENKSFPVKYMVVGSWIPKLCNIIDTSLEGNGRVVWRWMHLHHAHVVCKLLNQYEGFLYGR